MALEDEVFSDDEECGCCEIGEYAGDLDAEDVSCPTCGHSPEEHDG